MRRQSGVERVTDKIVPFAKGKLQQIRAAGKKQLSEAEYEHLEELLSMLLRFGLTPYINAELGKITAKLEWGLEISESPKWAEALIACDETFLGYELREMFEELGVDSPRVHKKELCRRLYRLGHPKVVEVMEPYLKGAE